MQNLCVANIGTFVRTGFRDGFAVPIALLSIFALMIMRGILLLPGGYDGTNGLTDTLLFIFLLWSLGMLARCAQPDSRVASGVVTIALFAAFAICSALAAASNAIGGGDYVDTWMIEIDHLLFPFYDWKAVAIALPNNPKLYWLLNTSYNSLEWQPLLFILLTIFGRVPGRGVGCEGSAAGRARAFHIAL